MQEMQICSAICRQTTTPMSQPQANKAGFDMPKPQWIFPVARRWQRALDSSRKWTNTHRNKEKKSKEYRA